MSSTNQPALQDSTFKGHLFYACCTSQCDPKIEKTTQILPQICTEKKEEKNCPCPSPQHPLILILILILIIIIIIIINPNIVTSKTDVVPWRPRNQFYPSLPNKLKIGKKQPFPTDLKIIQLKAVINDVWFMSLLFHNIGKFPRLRLLPPP